MIRAVRGEASPADVLALKPNGVFLSNGPGDPDVGRLEDLGAAGASLDRDRVILESLMGFKRAGATGVLTYHAVDAARLIAG